MQAHFDIAAAAYDTTFTNSKIGRMQRQRVWDYLEKSLSKKPLRILEINCGTGQDALFLADLGHVVTASDISKKMVEATQIKVSHLKSKGNIEVQQLDIKALKSDTFTDKFDLVFSNFGGLNCLNSAELDAFAKQLPDVLAANGRVIAVVMPPYNLMESLYFFLRLEWKKIFRRKTKNDKSIDVHVDGVQVPTWYFSPKQFANYFQDHFSVEAVQPIGYLPSFFEKLVAKVPFLISIDKALFRLRLFINASDHFLIDLKKK